MALAAPAVADSISASSGSVSATLHYTQHGRLGYVYRPSRLTITRRGRVFTQRVSWDQTSYYSAPDLRVVDLAGDGDPAVLIIVYTGGAHCCYESTIYGYKRALQRYISFTRRWGDGKPTIRHYGGTSEFVLVGSDSTYAYEFTHPEFGYPKEIWRYRPVELIDVVGCYPNIVRDDADYWWRSARRTSYTSVGYLFGYAADLYRLGEGDQAMSAIRGSGMPGVDQKYLRHLDAALAEGGYKRLRGCP